MDAPPLCLSEDIADRNDKSEPVPYLEDSVRIIIDWSEWRDLNSRPLDPQSNTQYLNMYPFWGIIGILA